jgi:hypothetical protein
MNVMQQSSKAYDRSLEDCFVYIEKGMVKLPRFQRMEAWVRGWMEAAALACLGQSGSGALWLGTAETVSA